MLANFDTTRCAVCGKVFTARTGNTFWIGNAQREILGVAHLKCQRRRGSGLVRVWLAGAPLDDLRFQLWHYANVPLPRRGAALYAGMLINGLPPTNTPNTFQARMLAHWSRPESEVGAALAQAAWQRYLELAAAYLADQEAEES